MPTHLRALSQRLLFLAAAAVTPLQLAAADGAAAAPPAAPSSAAPASPAQADPSPSGAEPMARLEAPLFSELFAKVPVAQVGDEVVTLEQLTDSIALMHEDRAGGAGTRKLDLGPALDRIINARLVVLEAREMGLDELDEVQKTVKAFRTSMLRETLKAEATKDVRPDVAEVEKAYAEAAREWKLKSVLFAKEEDATAMVQALKAGRGFDELAAQAVADKKAKGGEEATYVRARKMHPAVIAEVSKLAVGATSAPIKLPNGFAVARVDDVRTGDDPQVRGMLETMSRDQESSEALHAYYGKLVKKYAKVNKALLKGLNYHVKRPALVALFKDKRALATIRGDKPVTIADLSAEIGRKFYHGADRAAEEKKVNAKKQEVFDSLLFRRLLDKEAEQRNIAETDAFKKRVAAQEEELLFNLFVQRVVMPKVEVMESEGKSRYDEKKSAYMYPQFYKLESVAFATVKDAEAALAKLNAGTDMKWLRANAENQVKDPKLQLDGSTTLTASALGADVAKALAGAKVGDHRLHPAADGTAYVLRVVDETGATPKPYTDVRADVLNEIFAEKVSKAVEEWAAKLRDVHEVKVFIKGIGE